MCQLCFDAVMAMEGQPAPWIGRLTHTLVNTFEVVSTILWHIYVPEHRR